MASPPDTASNAIRAIDLNADLGEGFGRWTLGDDDALLGFVTSANVACGFHAGDPTVMRRTCARAAERAVVVGAQVGYRDLAGFGRRFLDVEADDLTNDVLYQLGALQAMAAVAGTRVAYVKPHGALYNAIVSHEGQAAAVLDAVRRYDATMPVLGLPGSVWLALAAEAGLRAVPEAFADRAYTPDGTLVSRRSPGAVLHDADAIAARCVAVATSGQIEACDGSAIPIQAESICVHGDTPESVRIAAAISTALHVAGIEIAPFTR